MQACLTPMLLQQLQQSQEPQGAGVQLRRLLMLQGNRLTMLQSLWKVLHPQQWQQQQQQQGMQVQALGRGASLHAQQHQLQGQHLLHLQASQQQQPQLVLQVQGRESGVPAWHS
jgi:hypothetical protein